ncbi:Putative pre-16S rRNA nuclease [Zhongshania aliphaticivorans]|uniref:Putative pre-16S rRNA nuclease n=1 Tax=Zhongshania aliphaticivorans TaxID=1470434 RepID=A0A5S9PPC0_9GAMM|nr:Holliday junction resolvase RuvX [Zhongshania aliphaticivorans]CAA0106183.1 Putative pre-16S rRNA nuclease [Zhongshania aliphaticivorans]CAA0106397.1 Putative pre-16S rRNA nuclease [Zhongshania aliphaticivorans]
MTHKEKTLLSFDFGLRWIGCAVGQTLTGTASPQASLQAKDGIPRWEDIEALLLNWKPDAVIVGLPLNMDGSTSEMSLRARKFGNRIHGRFGITVHFADERLSSFEARGDIIDDTGSRDFKNQSIDSRSAAIILESWMREP